MKTFVASRWSGDDNAVFPDRIEIDENKIIYYKGNLVGYNKSIIGRDKIASVHLRSSLFFADVVVESSGGWEVIGRGFAKKDAREIIQLLED